MSGTREWDAGTYDRVSAPQLRWGRAVLERLELNGDESVLDAGCGSGRVTELLLERLPAGRLIAVDGSLAMVEQARERLPSRVELVHSDLLELELDEPVDVVFSSATFHWIADHDRLFERIAGWLRPGGRLEAQCGGEGNVEAFLATVAAVAGRSPFADHLAGRGTPHYFAGVAETERRLAAAGLVDARCWLQRISERPPEPARSSSRSVSARSSRRCRRSCGRRSPRPFTRPGAPGTSSTTCVSTSRPGEGPRSASRCPIPARPRAPGWRRRRRTRRAA